MDKKDQKILTELLINSRIPINHLAKKVGTSREVTTYRLNKLTKNKINVPVIKILIICLKLMSFVNNISKNNNK